ncbi:MAG: hypothetical protein KJ879_00190 [Nanoarchaeota archaeon]|nr:hypothetical protein [Nanoarchaeota archaeon]
MGAGRTTILVVVSIFLVLSVSLTVVLFSMNSLLYPEIYIENLEASGTYDYLDSAVENISGGLMEINFLDIPEEGMKPMVDGALTNGLAYLRGDIDEFSVLVSVDGSGLKDFLASQMEEIPVCDDDESSIDLDGNAICRPAGESVSMFLDMMLIENGIDIPDQGYVDLAKVYDLQGGGIEEIKSYVGIYKTALYGSLILSLILITTIIFIPKEERKGLKVLGINLFISGILVTVSYLVATTFLNSASIQTEILMNFITGLMNDVLSKTILYGIIILVFGVAVFAMSFAIPEKSIGEIQKTLMGNNSKKKE